MNFKIKKNCECNIVFDLKNQHLCRRIYHLIEGEGGKIFSLAVGRRCERISYLIGEEGERISHLAVWRKCKAISLLVEEEGGIISHLALGRGWKNIPLGCIEVIWISLMLNQSNKWMKPKQNYICVSDLHSVLHSCSCILHYN